jgi:hypothetical protein
MPLRIGTAGALAAELTKHPASSARRATDQQPAVHDQRTGSEDTVRAVMRSRAHERSLLEAGGRR